MRYWTATLPGLILTFLLLFAGIWGLFFDAVHRLGLRQEGKGCFQTADLNHYLNWMAQPLAKRWFTHFFAEYHLPVRSELAQGLPQAELQWIEGGGHFVLEEHPQAVVKGLRALLERPVLQATDQA